MKKLLVIFAGASLALASCQSPTGLATSVDDVYYNPAKDRKPNVAPQPEQFNTTAQAQDPNAGKIAATAADQNNPYYKDPNFNYDDYYDNAYAARIRRFNNPIYGTGYYDSYNTNSYFYNGNPNNYGTSIYSSYNMGGSPYYAGSYYPNNGWGNYYSPSTSFWNSYYNPYYSGMSMGMGYGMGYGMNNMYGGYGYSPYSMYSMGYGCGGYNPYSYGMGYSPYGYSPYGYGYGMGMGYGGAYNPMTYYGGYYNSYDHNSSSYSNYGPRGTHAGGNSSTNTPVHPDHMMVKNPQLEGPAGTSPYSMDRFSQVSMPQERLNKIAEAKNPVMMNNVNSPMYQNSGNSSYGGGRPVYNSGGGYTGDGRPVIHNNGGLSNPNNGGSYNGNIYNGGAVSSPTYNNGGGRPKVESGNDTPKPSKWFGGTESGNTIPSRGEWGGNSNGGGRGSFGGGSSSGGGGSFGGGGSSGGSISRPHK